MTLALSIRLHYDRGTFPVQAQDGPQRSVGRGDELSLRVSAPLFSKGCTMILLHKMLNGLAALFSHAALWPVLWVLVLVGFSVLMLRLSRTLKTSRPWLVRKGECPFCGRELFGTTRTYQRLPLLKTLAPESKYLCISCDQEKVAGLLSTLEEER